MFCIRSWFGRSCKFDSTLSYSMGLVDGPKLVDWIFQLMVVFHDDLNPNILYSLPNKACGFAPRAVEICPGPCWCVVLRKRAVADVHAVCCPGS
jgi:hypothetical protein